MNAALYEILYPVMRDVCLDSRARHAGEEFYSVAIFTSGEYVYLCDSICTREGLRHVAQTYVNSNPALYPDVDSMMVDLKWSPCDSPYQGEFDTRFAPVQANLDVLGQARGDDWETSSQVMREIHETCVAVLRAIREENLFPGQDVVYNLLMGDQSDEERLLNAEEINDPETVARFRTELVIDEQMLAHLRETRWD